MTHKIPYQMLAGMSAEDFAARVNALVEAKRQYDAHLVKVRADALRPDLAPDERHVAFPGPYDVPEVQACIRVTPGYGGTTVYVADYEIVGPSLEEKQAKLFEAVSAAERDAVLAVAPQGKIRAWAFRENDIRVADQKRLVEHHLAQQLQEPGDRKPLDLDVARPAADTAFLAEQAAREARRDTIHRWAAQMHSDIEDLTAETVDAWQMKPING